MLKFVGPPLQGADNHKDTVNFYGDSGGCVGSLAKLNSSLMSLPTTGGGFPTCEYLGPELQAFCTAHPAAREEDWLARLAASAFTSNSRDEPDEYAALVARLQKAAMVELTATRAEFPLRLFAVWKIMDESQRLIVDARSTNCFFLTPPYEHTSGDDLARLQVGADQLLEVAKCDLADFFHTCEAPESLRPFFGLREVNAEKLRGCGVDVPAEVIDANGFVHPRVTTLPMGWGPSPAVAQGAHEAVLYGNLGDGSKLARQLPAVLDPAARWSAFRRPDLDSSAFAMPHALVIDDLLLFRQVPREVREKEDSVGISHDPRSFGSGGLSGSPTEDSSVEEDFVGTSHDPRSFGSGGLSGSPTKDSSVEEDFVGTSHDPRSLSSGGLSGSPTKESCVEGDFVGTSHDPRSFGSGGLSGCPTRESLLLWVREDLNHRARHRTVPSTTGLPVGGFNHDGQSFAEVSSATTATPPQKSWEQKRTEPGQACQIGRQVSS